MKYTDTLTNTELELIETIKNAKDPDKALGIALNLLSEFLERKERTKANVG